MFNRVYLAKNLVTGELVFIGLGERYDQKVYQLMWSIDSDDFLKMFNEYHTPKPIHPDQVKRPIPDYCDRIYTIQEYKNLPYHPEGSWCPSNGTKYWYGPILATDTHVVLFSK